MKQVREKMPIVILACRVMQGLMESHLRSQTIPTYMDYGLHRTPQKLTLALQAKVDAIVEPSTIILGYGLCGNGLAGLQARHHTLIVPRADDCIAILLGSYKRYREEFDAEPGSYYLTKGWLESGSHPLKEYNELLLKYDAETADWLIDALYHNYKRIVLIAPTQTELDACRGQARTIAEFCEDRWGMRYDERIGSAEFIKQLVTTAPLLKSSTEDFLVIPPGGEIKAQMFSRK
jgi:hypothetical protein